MATNSTPKTLADLKFQEHVIRIHTAKDPKDAAEDFFYSNFGTKEDVKVRSLFSEDGKEVYESYIDAGSVDYLYIIQ